jgi:hypothetical protein
MTEPVAPQATPGQRGGVHPASAEEPAWVQSWRSPPGSAVTAALNLSRASRSLPPPLEANQAPKEWIFRVRRRGCHPLRMQGEGTARRGAREGEGTMRGGRERGRARAAPSGNGGLSVRLGKKWEKGTALVGKRRGSIL